MDKSKKLGMNHSTANGRLVKDLLFDAIKDTPCARCGGPLERENFSIDHLVPWRTAADPIATYFDLTNISYSHHSCNSSATTKKIYNTIEEKVLAKRAYNKEWNKQNVKYDSNKRRERYQRCGT